MTVAPAPAGGVGGGVGVGSRPARPPGPAAEELSRSLRDALTGGDSRPCAVDRGTALAGALAPSALVVASAPAPTLWTVLRTAPDDGSRVLCVHNVGADPVSFDLHELLPPDPDDAFVHFLRGQVSTENDPSGRIVCRLEPFGFVWLATRLPGSPRTVDR